MRIGFWEESNGIYKHMRSHLIIRKIKAKSVVSLILDNHQRIFPLVMTPNLSQHLQPLSL